MSRPEWLPYTAAPEDYEREAESLLEAFRDGDDEARAAFKWSHPRFHGKPVAEVDPAGMDIDDARLVVAHRYELESWSDLIDFAQAVRRDQGVARFEGAVEAVVDGDTDALGSALEDAPGLATARSVRRHKATLLHYVAANGVEDGRQRTPPNAVEVARLLLEAGAEVDALADMYGARCTTMSMLVSSSHPAEAGLQAALAETLLDHGAELDGPGSSWQSALMTSLAFGYLPTAEALARRGAPVERLAAAAGLGRTDDTARLLPDADELERHIALGLAAQLGHPAIVRLLLDAGEDPDRYNPDGYHAHSTPLHQAVWSDHADVVDVLVSGGASLEIQDTIYGGTPLDWAIHGGRVAIADYLRARGAPTT